MPRTKKFDHLEDRQGNELKLGQVVIATYNTRPNLTVGVITKFTNCGVSVTRIIGNGKFQVWTESYTEFYGYRAPKSYPGIQVMPDEIVKSLYDQETYDKVIELRSHLEK